MTRSDVNRQSIVWLFLVLVAVYVILYYNTPLDQETIDRYELSTAQVTWLRTTILVPLMLVWLTALYGFVKLLQYAQTIIGSPESRPINLMAKGLMVLAFGF